jgi:hypothetical protein
LRFFSGSRIITWCVLLAIPFAAMGPAIGKVGLVLDDWFLWRAAAENRWFALDGLRPLCCLPMTLAHHVAGNNMGLLLVFNILAHGVAAILAYEFGRLLLSQVLPRSGRFFAAIAAAIFVIYPSDVSRYWFTASIGARFVTIELFAAALLWMVALVSRRPALVALAFLPAAVDLLRTESGVALLALMPFLTLARGARPWRLPWLVPSLLWYGMLSGYLVWHFALAKAQWAFGRFGSSIVDVRPIEVGSPLALIVWFFESLWVMTGDTVRLGFLQLDAALRSGADNLGLPLLAAGFVIAVALILWLANRDAEDEPEIATSIDVRGWSRLVLWSLLVAFAGVLPFLLNGTHYTSERTQAHGVLSRSTAIAAIGVSEVLVALVLLPLYRPEKARAEAKRRFRRVNPAVNLVAAGVLCAFVVSLGVIRLVQTGEDYASAWIQQKALLRAVLRSDGVWQSGAVVVLHDFPTHAPAPLTNESWAYRSALGLFLEPPPSDLFMTVSPADLQILPDNAGETEDWANEGEDVSVKWYLRERLRFPLKDLVVLTYDPAAASLVALDKFPPNDLPGGSPEVPLYTGLNRPHVTRRITDAAVEMLAPWPKAAACLGEVAVQSSDGAPREGTIAAFALPSGRLLDRRYVAAGAALNYSFSAPCGTSGALRFDPGARRFIDALPHSQLGSAEREAWHLDGNGGTRSVTTSFRTLHAASP